MGSSQWTRIMAIGKRSSDTGAKIEWMRCCPIRRIARVTTRTNNPYGKTPAQQDEIRKYLRDVEPRLRSSATIEFDARISTDKIADSIQSVMTEL